MRRFVVLLGALLTPAAAQADGTVGLRVTQAGFDWLANEVSTRVPPELDLEDQAVTLLECWSDDSVAQFGDAHVDVDRFELSMPIVDDQLTAELTTAVSLEGLATVSNIGCMPLAAECNVAIDVDEIALRAAVRIEVGEDGVPVLQVDEMHVDLDPEQFAITLRDCTGGLEDQVNPLIEQAEPTLIRMMNGGLQNWANGFVQPMLAQVLGQTMLFPIDRAEMDASVAVRDITIDEGALELRTDVGLSGREIAECVAPYAAPPYDLEEDHGVTFSRWDPSPFAVAVSERVVDEALIAVWEAGRLCTHPYEVNGFGGILPGIPDGYDLTVSVTVDAPPDAHVSPEGLSVDLNGIAIDVTADDDEGTVQQARFEGTIFASAGFDVDPATNGLRVVLGEIDLNGLELVEGALPDGTDVDLFMTDVVFPLALEKYGDIRVMSAVLPITEYWMIMNAVDYYDRSMAIVFELFRTPEDDDAAPETIVLEAPDDVVTPGNHEIVVTGQDDQVPERLIRYRIREDDGEWEEPTFSPTFVVEDRAPGLHTWYVQAVDLSGNEDPDPAKVTFEVAQVLPEEGHPDVEPPPDDDDASARPPTTGGDSGGGCSCRVAGGEGSSLGGLFGLGVAAVIASLRRRRRRRR